MEENELPFFYDPQNKVKLTLEEKEHIEPGAEEFIEKKEDQLFHIGQYQSELAKTVYCKHCGGKEFNVGREDYYTAIRCVSCEWECSVHEG